MHVPSKVFLFLKRVRLDDQIASGSGSQDVPSPWLHLTHRTETPNLPDQTLIRPVKFVSHAHKRWKRGKVSCQSSRILRGCPRSQRSGGLATGMHPLPWPERGSEAATHALGANSKSSLRRGGKRKKDSAQTQAFPLVHGAVPRLTQSFDSDFQHIVSPFHDKLKGPYVPGEPWSCSLPRWVSCWRHSVLTKAPYQKQSE